MSNPYEPPQSHPEAECDVLGFLSGIMLACSIALALFVAGVLALIAIFPPVD
jgi:hypothetical protein